MKVLDEQGNLFGVVNVVDALVVFSVLALVVVAAVLVGGSGGSGGDNAMVETRYATLDLGDQPWYVLERLDAGDIVGPAGATGVDGNATVTEVFVTPAENGMGAGHTYVRLALEGRLTDTPRGQAFEYDGDPIRLGSSLSIETADYAVDGRVVGLDRDGESLPTDTTPVVVEANVSSSLASQLSPGATARIGGHTVATVETVSSTSVGDRRTRVRVGAELATVERDGTPTYAGRPVVAGARLPIHTDAFELTGTVLRRGSVEPPDEPAAASDASSRSLTRIISAR